MITDKLDLIAKANLFEIIQGNGGCYYVEPRRTDSTVAAIIDKNGVVTYYATNGDGGGWAEINMEELIELKEFVKFLLD